jgi:RNA polymerase sigma factor (sigma-70 family)
MALIGPTPEPEELADEQLLAAYRAGDEGAATALFKRYYARLVGLARKRMGRRLREVEESSDVALSVFESVFLRGRADQITIGANDSLWPLLVTITINKIRNRVKYWERQRRDRRREVSLEPRDPLESGPLPEDEASLQELIEQLLEPFSERRRRIIQCMLQGVPVSEIAALAGTSERTVYKTRQAVVQILERIIKET